MRSRGRSSCIPNRLHRQRWGWWRRGRFWWKRLGEYAKEESQTTEANDHHRRWPNGAGKTAFAQTHLPERSGFPDFINADLIAQGLSPSLAGGCRGQKREESCWAVNTCEGCTGERASCYETTLAARTPMPSYITGWRKHCLSCQADFPELAVRRLRGGRALGMPRIAGRTRCPRKSHSSDGLQPEDETLSNSTKSWWMLGFI